MFSKYLWREFTIKVVMRNYLSKILPCAQKFINRI